MRRLKHVLFVLAAVFILLIGTAAPSRAIATDLLISGVIDGPLTGGIPKAVELYVVNDIPDLSIFGIGAANNGGGTDGEEFTFPADSATAGDFIYVATESTAFNDFFGFTPDYTDGTAVSVNGDDAIELFENGSVIDVFGDINTDGTGEPWEYLDGWAYRVSGTEADGTIFNLANWTFSGPNALDGETTNDTATTPFPLGTFMPLDGDAAPSVASTDPANAATGVAIDANITINFSEDVTVTGSWFDIACSVSGAHTAVASGGPASYTLDPDTDFANGENCTVTVFAAQVTDNDTDDPPDAMSSDASFSFDTVSLEITDVVINEFLADPAADDPGDANGDGTRDSSDDEFIEIVNVSGADLDVSGWSISDAVQVRHVFPSGSVIPADCSLVVFGGGTPTGSFGGAVVQTASDGALGFNNSGDTITLDDGGSSTLEYVYGSEGGNNQSITRDPDITGTYVEHSTASASGGALFSPGTGLDGTPFSGCTFGTPVTIMEIQGAAHLSAYESQSVQTDGIVTVVTGNSFYLQDPTGDGNDATSDALVVFTGSTPTVAVGDAVTVIGTVDEFYPGGFGTGNLSETNLVGPTVTINSSGNALPAPIVLGNGGRIPPSTIIDDDSTGDVNSTLTFDPENDGIDFYESVEAMLVQVNDAQVVGGTRFGEIAVVGDFGANATGLTARGGVVISANDFNPERIIIDDGLVFDEPDASVGDTFTAPIVGVMDYTFGNFKLLNFDPLPALNSNFTAETTSLSNAGSSLTVASLNVENLDPSDSQDKFDALASQIVNNLGTPTIIGVQEVQDNTGSTNDGVTDASMTYQMLIDAIQAAGGPVYEYRDIAPLDLTDGGQPGGNIRVGFLFRPDQVTFVDRAGGDATTAATVSLGANGVELSVSPGRVDPTNVAWDDSRKPLAAEFIFGGQTIIVVNNHFNSKGGDDSLFGRVQPPVLDSEVQRLLQAAVINGFVQDILALDPNANVIVMGDLNDFQFSAPVDLLEGSELNNLLETLPASEQYTYQFEGNLQILDHILVSDNLFNNFWVGVDVVHGNAELDTDLRFTDHDPVIAQFTFPYIINADGCYVVALEGSPFNGPATIVSVGDPGYNGFRFHAGRWGRAQGFGNDTCYEVHGTDNSEIITGGLTDDLIFGYDGDDFLIGLFGDDTFSGGAGADFVNGNNGLDEILDYEPGVDFLFNVELGY
ncbi:lamin tail domain-containing protein [Candidatus Leptofilum sp.]|uniref:lamin tail domain-containing protein n=1 Tax=Candidatus Leptofilum sp. TaxID=3241576 RepID=UPI003B59DDFE